MYLKLEEKIMTTVWPCKNNVENKDTEMGIEITVQRRDLWEEPRRQFSQLLEYVKEKQEKVGKKLKRRDWKKIEHTADL
jgi:hypothetical protein